jgi:pimeloyl-ACP methyl ester carboxylesterase
MWTRRTVATALRLLAAACGGDPSAHTPTSPTPTTSAEATSRFPALSEEELLAMSEPVSLRGEGGVHLEGRLFGSGEVGVVLAHMGGSGDQSQWLALAGLLAEHGYRVLTYNRRGSCPAGDLGCSGGRNEGGGWQT